MSRVNSSTGTRRNDTQVAGAGVARRRLRCVIVRSVTISYLLFIVWKEPVPSFVPMQSLKSQESFIAIEAPELTCPLEAALILGAGGLHGTGPKRLVECFTILVIHPVFMSVKIADLSIERFTLLAGQIIKIAAYFLKVVYHIQRAVFTSFQP